MKNIIIDRIKELCKSHGDQIAIRYMDQSITYKELERTTSIIASQIRDCVKNINVGIIIYEHRGIEFIKYMIAIIKVRCYYIPIEYNMPIERVRYIYKDADARLIISSNTELINLENYKVLIPKDIPQNVTEFSNIIDDDDLVYIMYTSGTSGRPKGVQIQYSNLFNLVRSFKHIIYGEFIEKINVGLIASLSFDASVKQIFCSLYYGETLVIAEDRVRYFGRKLHDFHYQNNLTICDCTPSVLKLMIMQKTKKISNIPYIIIGGENLSWQLLKHYSEFVGYQPNFINVYGPTECCVDVSYKYIDKSTNLDKSGSVPIGIPLLNTELFIKDEYSNIIERKNVDGELYISGKQVGKGYVNIKSDSFLIDTKSDERIYKTGDIAHYNEDNEIIISGRIDDQIKLNGYRIEIGEISSLIENKFGCQCVVRVYERNEFSRLVAFIAGGQINEIKYETIISYLELYLPKYMIPKEFTRLDKIHLNNNGKVDENYLKQIYNETY